jgi:integrase
MVVAGDGTAYVSQNFAGLLTAIPPGGKPQVVFAAPGKGTEVGALSESGGVVHFATTKGRKAALWWMRPGGKPVMQADLGAYEARKNPDAKQAYGFSDLDATCLAQVPTEVPGSYTGVVDSHPYGSAVRRGTTYVADAASNSILGVDAKGKVSTVAVIEPAKVGALLRAIDDYEGRPETVFALKLAPHIFLRPGELRQAKWSEIDFADKVWRIPAEPTSGSVGRECPGQAAATPFASINSRTSAISDRIAACASSAFRAMIASRTARGPQRLACVP